MFTRPPALDRLVLEWYVAIWQRSQRPDWGVARER
jgi:hypothetical protein